MISREVKKGCVVILRVFKLICVKKFATTWRNFIWFSKISETKAFRRARRLQWQQAVPFRACAPTSSLGFLSLAVRGAWCGLWRKSWKRLQPKSNSWSVLTCCLAVWLVYSSVYWQFRLFWVFWRSCPPKALRRISIRAFLSARCIIITLSAPCLAGWFLDGFLMIF